MDQYVYQLVRNYLNLNCIRLTVPWNALVPPWSTKKYPEMQKMPNCCRRYLEGKVHTRRTGPGNSCNRNLHCWSSVVAYSSFLNSDKTELKALFRHASVQTLLFFQILVCNRLVMYMIRCGYNYRYCTGAGEHAGIGVNTATLIRACAGAYAAIGTGACTGICIGIYAGIDTGIFTGIEIGRGAGV